MDQNRCKNWITLQDDLSKRRISSAKFEKDFSKTLIPLMKLNRIVGAGNKGIDMRTATNQQVQSTLNSRDGTCLFCLKLNREGDVLAITSADCVQLWNMENGQLLHKLTGHTEIVTSLIWLFSNNNNSSEQGFFTGSLDKTIKFWKQTSDTYKVMATYKEHNDWIRCLGLSTDNRSLVSGCVSAVIFGWDIETGKVSFKISKAHKSEWSSDLNTINALQFSNISPNVFVSGARDGIAKIWDVRSLSKPTHMFQAHSGKLNTMSLSSHDTLLLSSGRDSTVRLWDMRKIGYTECETTKQNVPPVGQGGLLREFNSHKCSSYNVVASFFNKEHNIVTGSEDGRIFIYDTEGEQPPVALNGHPFPSVIHLVDSCDNDPLTLVSSSIENGVVSVWSPSSETTRTETALQDLVSQEETQFANSQRSAVESLMQKHGDQILRMFHKFNFTFGSPVDWHSLAVNAMADPQSTEFVKVINEMSADFVAALSLQQRQARQQRQEQRRNTTTNNNNNNHQEDEDDTDDEDDQT